MAALGVGDRLCAVCVLRPAELLGEIDERTYPLCRACHDQEVAEPAAPIDELDHRERVLRALAHFDACDIREISELVGEDDDMGRRRVSAVLNRAVRRGLAACKGGRMDRVYWLPKHP